MSGQYHRVQYHCEHYATFRGSRPEIGDCVYCFKCANYKHVIWTRTRGHTIPFELGQEVCRTSDIP